MKRRTTIAARSSRKLTLADAKRRILKLTADKLAMQRERDAFGKQRDDAFQERNALLWALSMLWPAHLMPVPGQMSWRWAICLHMPHPDHPDGLQMAWRLPDEALDAFAHLERVENHWDGHTKDQKYARLALLAGQRKPSAP